MSNHTIHILDTATFDTLDVMMVVFDPSLVSGACRIRQADATDETFAGKVLHDQVNSLQRDGRQGRTNTLEDRFSVTVGVMVQIVKHGYPLDGRAKTFGPKGLGPVVFG